MEPQVEISGNKTAGLAPIIRWSSLSSSMGGSSIGTFSSPAKSVSSSGIVPDSTSKSEDNEPEENEEKPLFPSSAAVFASVPDVLNKSPTDSNEDTVTVIPKENIQLVRTGNNNNNNNEGVKFDVPLEEDSIMSSVESLFDDGDESKRQKPKVPDGGWGWMVVLSSLIISMIADGISFSFGLLYIRFLKYFKESKSTTSWIGSLFMAVPLLSGPIGSALVDRFGCRWMTILGGIVSGTGFVLSAFCDTIVMMYITFGVIAGLGLGLCYVTAVVSIAYWFDKKRSLATGLGACGTGVGTVVYAPMTQFFIEQFGWRGTVIMLAGTFLNMCVCGALMRDPEWWIEEQKTAALSKSNRESSSASLATAADLQALEEIREMLKSGESPEYILTQLATNIAKSPAPTQSEDENNDKSAKANVQSVYNLPTYVQEHEKVPLEVLASLSSNKKVFNVILENYPSLLTCRSMSDNCKINQICDKTRPTCLPVTMKVTSANQNQSNRPIVTPTSNVDTTMVPLLSGSKPNTKSVKYESAPKMSADQQWKKKQSILNNHHYLRNIKVHRNSVMYRGAVLNTYKYHLRASSCPDIYRNSMTTLAREAEESWKTELKEMLANMCDFSMFLELHFLLMSVATILLFTWFIVPYFYLAEHMTRHNYNENEASNVISVIGFTNTIGMIGLGYLGDQPWVDVTKAYAFCLVACGIATCGMPYFTDNYWVLIAFAALWGLFFASNFSFTPPIIVKLIPLERFTIAYGLMLLCQGIGNLLGPPLAGLVFDVTGYWDWSFYLAGFWIVVSGLLVAGIPVTNNRIIWGSGVLERDKDSIV
ncbi:monocarboxylate transporter 9-like [Lycorma delicatula]|uniref:monocarboxylate transporter 9-like n=1 Tax=Lycorma delicatula TaxID=130591 RepID=UPI003F50FFEB